MAAPVVRASPLAAFQARARRCFEGRQLQLCEQALIEAEALQQQASARSAYPCQTLLSVSYTHLTLPTMIGV